MTGNTILAAATAASKSGSSGSTTFLLIIVVMIVVFYFLLIRPQRNRQRRVTEQQNSVLPGARVRTTAGMYATVTEVDGNDVLLEVAPGIEVRYVKRAIMEVLPDESPAPDEDDDAGMAEGAGEAPDADGASEAEAGDSAPDEGATGSHQTAQQKAGDSA